MKWEAGSEIAPHSCDQMQSRRTVKVAVVANSATTARFSLCRAATVAKNATVEDGAVVRKFRTTRPVCANFAHTAANGGIHSGTTVKEYLTVQAEGKRKT